MADILPSIIYILIITFTYLVPAVAIVALLMWLLRRLVRKSKLQIGFLLILITCLLITGASYLFTKSWSTSIEGRITVNVNIKEDGVISAEIQVAQDSKTKEIYGFGPLIISDQKGNRYIPMSFNNEGMLIGSKDALQYVEPINKAVKDIPGKEILTGNSLSLDQMQSVVDNKLTKRHEIFSWQAVVVSMLQWNTVTLFLIIYYLILVIRNRKKSISAKHTEIRDL